MSNYTIPFWQNLKDYPIFCAFDVQGDIKSPYGIDGKKGISHDAAFEKRGTYETVKQLGYNFTGVSLVRPIEIDGQFLVCIDLDWKRSPYLRPEKEQEDLIVYLQSLGAAYETSYSSHGAHFWILCDKDKIPGGKKLRNNCEIEIFSGFPDQRANVLLTDYDFDGALISVDLTQKLPPKQAKERTQTAPQGTATLEELKSPLYAIPPDDYDTWLKVGMILKYELGDDGYYVWTHWSEQSDKYDPFVFGPKWDSFKGDGLKAGTLIALAIEHGYQKPKASAAEDFNIKNEKGEYVSPKKSYLDAAAIQKIEGLQAPQWVIDGIIPNGVGVIAGVGGVGKTTAIMPLVAMVAGFDDHLSDIKVKIHRHVLYITEDAVQAQKAIYSIKKWRKSEKNISTLEDFVHLYNSKQYGIAELQAILIEAVERYSMEYRGIMFPPLVVFDTAAANIQIENENDNAEIAKFMTMFKQVWARYMMPIWLVNHLAKSANGLAIDELDTHSARGASAWRDNSNWTANLAIKKDSNERILQMMKVREELDFNEIEFSSVVHDEIVNDVFGDPVTVKYRYCTAMKSSKNMRMHEAISAMDEAIFKAVRETAYPSINDIKEQVNGRSEGISSRIKSLLAAGLLYKKQLPNDVKMRGRTDYLSDSP